MARPLISCMYVTDVRARIVAARRLVASASATTAETATGGLAPWQIAKVRAHVARNIERGLPNDELAALTRLSTPTGGVSRPLHERPREASSAHDRAVR